MVIPDLRKQRKSYFLALHTATSRRNATVACLPQGVVHPFVRIQTEHPVVAGLAHAERFLVAVAGKFALDDACPCRLSHSNCGIRRKRIDHEDFIAKGD